MQTNLLYIVDLLFFAPMTLYMSWPPRMAEFGSPLVICVLLLAWVMVLLSRRQNAELHALFQRRLTGLLILCGSCYIISWSVPFSDYLASQYPSISDDCYSVSHLLDRVYAGLVWLIFPWIAWMAFQVLVKVARQQAQ